MEDRHTISEPRLLPREPKVEPTKEPVLPWPCWQVDIYRKGVVEPIGTVCIHEETLPPRMNKKGKILWRLPTQEDKLPSFGTDEKRRILELFKEQKKNRKKSQPTNNTVETTTATFTTTTTTTTTTTNTTPSTTTPTTNTTSATINPIHMNAPDLERKEIKKEKDTIARMTTKTPLLSPPPGFVSPPPLDSQNTLPFSHLQSQSQWQAQEQHNKEEEKGDRMVSNHVHLQESISMNPITESPNSSSCIPMTTLSTSSSIPTTHLSSSPSTFSSSFSSLVPPPTATTTIPTTPSMTKNQIAQTFLQLYYPYIQNGWAAQLAMYYTQDAQKSVSVGDAHSMVTGTSHIMAQLHSFQGTQFFLRGVVVQDSYPTHCVQLLMTGILQTVQKNDHPMEEDPVDHNHGHNKNNNNNNNNNKNNSMNPKYNHKDNVKTHLYFFAHCISLIPASFLESTTSWEDHDNHDDTTTNHEKNNNNNNNKDTNSLPFPYRIHNDALSIVVGEEWNHVMTWEKNSTWNPTSSQEQDQSYSPHDDDCPSNIMSHVSPNDVSSSSSPQQDTSYSVDLSNPSSSTFFPSTSRTTMNTNTSTTRTLRTRPPPGLT